MSLESLQLVFEDACTRYQNTKSEIAGVDFLDLEFLVEKLLDSHPEVVADYHSRFKHVLVDELILPRLPGALPKLIHIGGEEGVRRVLEYQIRGAQDWAAKAQTLWSVGSGGISEVRF